MRRPAFPLPLAILVAVLTGCAAPRPAGEGAEYLIPTPTRTYYFQSVPQRICYSFHVPGQWGMGATPALLQRPDGRGLVGVLMWSVTELGGGSVEAALQAAAERSARPYDSDTGRLPWTLVPFRRVPGVWEWHVPRQFWRQDRVVSVIPKWFVPLSEGWIAEFTIGAPPETDPDTFVETVIRSLSTTHEPRCYADRMRQLRLERPR